MRFFHLSDLHLGKTLHGHDLLEDQAFILEAIVEKAKELEPRAILIAGDIYDRAIPPVEAIKLFDSFIERLKDANPGVEIVVVPGNHDSAGRLSFGARAMAGSGVRIVADLRPEPVLVLEENDEKVAVWALPFLTQTNVPAARRGEAVSEGDPSEDTSISSPAIRSQGELAKAAMDEVKAHLDLSSKNILVAHCYASGALAGDSENSYVGSAEQVDPELFSAFDYVALGHLHSFQSPAPKVWYSGSPLAYTVLDAEKEKGFAVVELGPKEAAAAVRFVPLVPLRAIRKLSGFIGELVAHPLPPAERDEYLEIDILDAECVLDANERLRSLYPKILSIHQLAYEVGFGGAAEGGGRPEEAGGRGAAASFDALETVKNEFRNFHVEMRGLEPTRGMEELFESIAREAIDAAD